MEKITERSVFERAEEAARERLKQARVTQVELAKLAGIRQPSVREWKIGSPSVDTAKIFCIATGICIEWLLTGRGPKRPPPSPDTDLAKLYDRWDGLSERKKGRILEVMEDDAGSSGAPFFENGTG